MFYNLAYLFPFLTVPLFFLGFWLLSSKKLPFFRIRCRFCLIIYSWIAYTLVVWLFLFCIAMKHSNFCLTSPVSPWLRQNFLQNSKKNRRLRRLKLELSFFCPFPFCIVFNFFFWGWIKFSLFIGTWIPFFRQCKKI